MKPNTDESEYITRSELADVLESMADQFASWPVSTSTVQKFTRAAVRRLRQPPTDDAAFRRVGNQMAPSGVRSPEQIRVEIKRLEDVLESFPYEPWKGEAYNAAVFNLRVSGYGKIAALKWTLREALPGLDKEIRVIKSLDKPLKPTQGDS